MVCYVCNWFIHSCTIFLIANTKILQCTSNIYISIKSLYFVPNWTKKWFLEYINAFIIIIHPLIKQLIIALCIHNFLQVWENISPSSSLSSSSCCFWHYQCRYKKCTWPLLKLLKHGCLPPLPLSPIAPLLFVFVRTFIFPTPLKAITNPCYGDLFCYKRNLYRHQSLLINFRRSLGSRGLLASIYDPI